ncbi:MAG TPA: VirB4 family type IV secretion/conjugal transfer ATPase, partial [Steroidobacteraceae bacterium]|nr:VirB4 family type IV secretion/conjugal transfer ATPase [Steroidobacteraceae bacterium]
MSSLTHAARARRDTTTAQLIPYTAHVADNIIKTSFGDYVQIFQLAGASFESADDVQLNAWHERLNVLWRNIATPQVALWTHVIRRREQTSGPRRMAGGFADTLNARYQDRLSSETLMVNQLFLATV